MKKLTINQVLTQEYRKLRKAAIEKGEETWRVAGLPQFKGYWVEPTIKYGKNVWYVYNKD